jgi:SAM-dependent methyltransferase
VAIDLNTAKFLIECRAAGVSFARTITLGHQALVLSPGERRSLFKSLGNATAEDQAVLAKGGGYADGLFEMLGAEEMISIDASPYEGASLVHDMNDPLPADHIGQFDLVFDGGTLEHIFNFPCALRNCMELVRPGGHLILHTPTNNWSGHGFYQFSPEVFFRAFSAENGYKVERMVAYEVYHNSPFYEVSDPAQVRSRVELARGHHRVLLLVLAKRLHVAEIFKEAPQQSDYVAEWAVRSTRTSRAQEHTAQEQTAVERAALAWKEGRLLRALRRRLLVLAGADTLADMYEARRLSLKRQPKVFRPLSGHKGRSE